MIETLIVSLILATVSGLTFIAYKHPDGYKNIATPMLVIGSLIVLLIVSVKMGAFWWAVGNINKEYIENPDQSLQDISYTIKTLVEERKSMLQIVLIALPFIAYLIFLWYLPKVLCIKHKEAVSSEDKKKSSPD